MEIWDKEWEVEVRRTIIGGWISAVSSFSSFDKILLVLISYRLLLC